MEQELLLTGCVVCLSVARLIICITMTAYSIKFAIHWNLSNDSSWPIIPLASSATNGYSRISERQVSGENRFITHVIFLAGFSLLRIIHLAE
jgi:hypothetical protein